MNEALRWTTAATRGTGRTVEAIANNPLVRGLGNAVGLGRLLDAIDRVDVTAVRQSVDELRSRYPGERPGQIAERIVAEKALYAGGLGAAASVTPGFLLGFLAVDLAATLLLQAQMVYQIAAAYGLDLTDVERKGEVVLIFGLAFGGTQAIRLGSGPIGRLPVMGTAVNAGAHAATVYAVGLAACRFYEAKLSEGAAAVA